MDHFIKAGDRVVDIAFIQELESLVIVCRDGEIWKFTPMTKSIDNVGSFDVGIYSAQWSPNEETLAVATKNQTIVLMSTSFDPRGEVHVDEALGAQIDSVLLSWRGDSKFFSVSYHVTGGWKAYTKDLNLATFVSAAKSDAEGGLVQCVAEKVQSKLLPVLAWQPNGSLVASAESLPIEPDKPAHQ
jgi:hypothetical protein